MKTISLKKDNNKSRKLLRLTAQYYLVCDLY